MIENPPKNWQRVDAPFLKNRFEHPSGVRLTYDHGNDELIVEQKYGVLWKETNQIPKEDMGRYHRTFLLGVMMQVDNADAPWVTSVEPLFESLDEVTAYSCDCGRSFNSQHGYAGHKEYCKESA